MRSKILVIGHSHVVAIRDAALQMADASPGALKGCEFRFVNLLNPQIGFPPIRANDPTSLPPEFTAIFEEFRPDVTVMAIHGNEHNVLALVEHPRKLDFIFPEEPQLPLDTSREVLPFEAVETILKRKKHWVSLLLGATRHLAVGRLAVLDSPPPIPAEEHIRAYPETFYEMINAHGVAPAALRYKVWRTQSRILQNICTRHGITFLPVPPKTLDEQGMLARRAWANDATHGNAWYGMQVVRQIVRFAVAPDAAGNALP